MIKTVDISESIINELSEIFSSKIVNDCLKKGMWISGGFARKVGHLCLGLDKQKPIDAVVEYFGEMNADIDFYGSDIKTIKNICNSRNTCNMISPFYKTPFASNVDLEFRNLEKYYYIKNIKIIPIQLVTKFLFKDVSECFESIDITNCKYAIIKKDDSYQLQFDSKALDYDLKKQLHISHSESPYTISRIRKYIKDSKRGITSISKDKETISKFNELLYKIVENKWPETYNMKTENFVLESLKNLSSVHSLTDFELSLFIGKITESICTNIETIKNGSGYGVFVNYVYEERDWASNKINSRVK